MNIETLLTTIRANTTLDVTAHGVQKGDAILTGISFGTGTLRPILYVKDYKDLFNEPGYEAVAKKMIEIVESNLTAPEFDNVDQYMSYEYAKEHLRLCIGPKGTNEGMVTSPYLDLEMYVRVVIENDDIASYKVHSKMLDVWNVTKESLFDIALTATIPAYKVQSMSELLFGFKDDSNPMMVANTADGFNGASIIYCKGILQQVANKFDDDLIIIPSSIHEIILQPVGDLEVNEVTEIIQTVNTEQVAPEEVLSDHAYIFHKDTGEITW